MLGQTHTPEELQEILQETIYQLGRMLYLEGRDYDRAVSLLNQTVFSDPNNVHALYYYGQAIRAQVEFNTLKRAEDALRLYIEKGAPLGHEEDIRHFLETRQASPAYSGPVNPG